ncbi:MAG TPA: VIT domain-containing protein [Verrucomicrobiae bacterium]
MKRVLFALLLVTLTLNTQLFSFSAGLIIIENAEEALRIIPPPDRPPGRPPEHPPFRPVPPPHWMPRPIHRLTPLEVKSVKASATIKEQVAQTKIEQEFYNPNPRQLEGTFIMPLPSGAHLDKFRMEVNGKMTEAELLSADKAKGIYEEIVRKAKDPALLEFLGRDLIKVRIFPIEPHSTKKIEVSYAQVLKKDGDLAAYTIPLNVAKYGSTPMENFSLKLEIESATPLKTIYSPTHNVEVIRHGNKTATIGMEQKELADKDLELFYSAEKSDVGMNLLTCRKPGEDGYFMLFASPGFGAEKTKSIPKDVIFVLDTSGSMSGKKLEQAKKALTFCIQNLNEEDRFEVIRFSTETESLFREVRDVSDSSRKEAEEFVTKLKTIGGTAINDALKTALETGDRDSRRPKLVVFLTDGLPTVGETSVEGILSTVKERSKGTTRVFAFGVGTDVNTHLLDRIAEETRAASQYVLPDEDLEVKLGSFFSKINDPVLAELSLDFGDIKTSNIHPGKLPDLFKGQQSIIVGRYKNDGKTTVSLRGKIGDEEKKFTEQVAFPKDDTKHEFIPRLWATRRVGFLLEEIRHRGENAELKDEVTQLARQYGIVTPYTSFLVTEDSPVLATRMLEERQLGRNYSPARPALQAAPSAERERLVRAQAADQSGDAAVAGARYNYSLKSVENVQQLHDAPAEVNLYVSTGQLQSFGKLSGSAGVPQAQKFVGQRTFQNNGSFWDETTVLASKSEPAVRLEFGSKEYWDFVTKNTELNEVFAIGTNLRFLFEGKIYEVYSKNI